MNLIEFAWDKNDTIAVMMILFLFCPPHVTLQVCKSTIWAQSKTLKYTAKDSFSRYVSTIYHNQLNIHIRITYIILPPPLTEILSLLYYQISGNLLFQFPDRRSSH